MLPGWISGNIFMPPIVAFHEIPLVLRLQVLSVAGRLYSNNNALVFETFDKAVKANPGAHPIFHSDRGYQYTSRRFHQKLEEAGMVQSMSRVAHCTDNGVMEGFWGILKREMYYGKKFESREELEKAITEYIDYYTNDRPFIT